MQPSFRRKESMVKHQQRDHKQEANPNGINGGSSDLDYHEAPPDRQSSSMACSPRDMFPMLAAADFYGAVYHAPSYTDSKAQIDGYRHGLFTTIHHEYHEPAVPERQTHGQLDLPAGGLSQPTYYVIGQENDILAAAASASPFYCHEYYSVEPYIEDMPYPTSEVSTSIQSSPGTSPTTSVPSPTVQDGFYAYQPTQHYTAQLPQVIVSGPQDMLAEVEDFYRLSLCPQQEQWTRYGPPVEGTTTG
ncbi:transcription factor [Fusarium langsethiae]|uniref:Transcription factor n=1 Tax=Fusarium langsethiae TaxID=179993 RepID=A0A0M9EN03_FUSLA|nr:transcription factor [Fusarium langsethiae]GKU11965.1 unnamed protein product [Fusarium langsethiae]